MALETGTYISDLVATNPTSTDAKSQGDDHLRLVKSTLKTTFPNITGAVTPTHTELNYVAGLTAQPAAKDGSNLTTPATGDSSTKIATTAFVAATAFSSALPAQTGNAGKYVTTNGTTASWASVVIPGTGGQTATGSLTLTASSAAAITVTPATPGLYATLPDATTCTKADNLFAIYNAGDYDYGVKDSAGTQLGWVRARTGAMIGLADLSTAAGVWAYYGLEKTGITASYVNSTLTNMDTNLRRIALDANRTCFLFGGVDCYAIVYDASTQTWGSAALVRAAVKTGTFVGVLSATNQVLVATCTTAVAAQFVTLTISGTGVTVNTPVAKTLTGTSVSSFGQLVAVGSSFVLAFGYDSATASLLAITVSGTVPTVGTQYDHSAGVGTSTPAVLFVSGSVVRCVLANTSIMRCQPATISGATITPGTEATAVTTVASFRAFLNGNGNIVCQYINSSHYATIFKLTGTTEAASSVSLGTAPTSVTTNADYLQVTASKTLFGAFVSGTGLYFNILTDTAGTASAGTELAQTTNVSISFISAPFSVGNIGYFCFGGVLQLLGINASGTSPTLSSSLSMPATFGIVSNIYGVKFGFAVPATGKAVNLSTGTYYVLTANTVIATSSKTVPSVGNGANNSVTDGANGSYAVQANILTNNAGVIIKRVEAAA